MSGPPFAPWWKLWPLKVDTTATPPGYTHRVSLPPVPAEITAVALSFQASGELRTTVTVRSAPHFLRAFLGRPRRQRRSRGWRRHVRRTKAAGRRSR